MAEKKETFNPLTGSYQKEGDDKELSSMTGLPVESNESGKAQWPSISKRDSEQEEAGQEQEQVEKKELKWPSLMSKGENESEQEQEEEAGVSKSNDIDLASCFHRVLGGNSKDFEKSFSMDVPIFVVEKADKDEHVVMGIVYEPDTVDAQGDQASADEIKKAAYNFMENNPVFKIQHKGKPAKVKILESYIAPQDFTISKRDVKKGSWVLVTRVLDKKLWKDIKEGKFTGYSMAGTANVA